MKQQTRPERVAELIRDFWPHRMSGQASEAIERLYSEETIDAAHLRNQREWSASTFGPGARLGGILEHIRKELVEIEEDPTDVAEWVDVIILAFDGAWRAGGEPQQIIDAIKAKQAKNEARTWPDWREFSQDEAIEHVEVTAMTATITLRPATRTAALHLFRNSQLGWCAQARTRGTITSITAERPLAALSSGEQVLWESLSLLTTGDLTAEDVDSAATVLDADNTAVLRAALDLVRAAA